MTEKQLDAMNDLINHMIAHPVPNNDIARYLRDLHSCYSMVNSILAYGGWQLGSAEAVLLHDEQSYHSYLANFIETLGRDNVLTIIQEQMDSIKGIVSGTFTDSEGGTYNTIMWLDT